MRCLRYKWILPALLLGLLLVPTTAYADLGPKPEASYAFDYQVPRVQIVSGELWQCKDAACTDGEPLRQLGPQGFGCEADSCHATAYGFAEYQKLVIRFEDRTRESNVFRQEAFAGVFIVAVRETDLVVTERVQVGYGSRLNTFTRLLYFAGAVAITLVLELIVASLFFRRLGKSCWLLLLVVLGNAITLPIVWFVFPVLGLGSVGTIVAAELFAWLAEAGILFAGSLGRVPLKHALVIALAMNLASFWVGLVVG